MLNSLELREWLNKLVQLAELMAQGSAYSEEDHFAFMSICFLNKQIDHARSILALIPRRDAMLIARSMIEGIAQLLWAAKNPEVLPLRWRTFAWVHDWRLMQEMSAMGDIIDEQRRSDIEDALRKHCDQFLKRKGQKARDKGTSMGTDPYYTDWRCGVQIRQICQAVAGEVLYKKVYIPFSDWHHWGAGGLGQAIVREGNQVLYSPLSEQDSGSALATAFQCLLQTSQIFDSRLAMSFSQRLAALREDYITAQNARGDSQV